MRASFAAIAVLCVLPIRAQSQAFDVASVKPAHPAQTPDGTTSSTVGNSSPGTIIAVNANLGEIIRWAYVVKEYQVSGPDWLDGKDLIFDITAKAAPGTPTRELRLMTQTLLADRFKLALHRETRMLPILALKLGKNSPKLHEAANPNGRSSASSSGGPISFTNLSMSELAEQLARETGRVVLDQTELKGSFDMTLDYAKDPANDSAGRASIFEAIQEQLGLKLEATKGPVEVLVIDHVEKVPTDN